MIRQKIARLLENSIRSLQKDGYLGSFKILRISVERPKESTHGDYSSSVALQLGRAIGQNPLEVAQKIKEDITKHSSGIFEKIEVAAPGFINLFLSKDFLRRQLKEILKTGGKFENLKTSRHKKVQVEFISANPTGPLTLGNARGGPFGDTLANALEAAGFKVEKAYYINNTGNQILVLGHSVLKDAEAQYRGAYIDYLSKRIKEKDPYKAGQKAANIILKEMIQKTIKKMGIKFDEWFSEESLHKTKQIDKVLQLLKRKRFLYEQEGAVWFQATKFGDTRDRVVIKQDGQKTYLAADIAYHKYKFGKKKFDKVINIWGADHTGDVAGLRAGVSALGYRGKLDIILLQFVTLLEKGEQVRMSKRSGVYVTMDEVLNQIGPDVVRFFLLQKSPDTHLDFDLVLAKEQSEKNPVYYIQYAHARISSILRKYKKDSKLNIQNSQFSLLDHPSELNLIKQLIRLPEIIADIAGDYQVQRLPQYALELAESFHHFYQDCKVLTEDKELTKARLALVLATKHVLKRILGLMGISAPEKM